MQEQNLPTDISYTNKDFQSIYVELLDLVKKLTNKWDPSLSNESDPGVILLKLNALIADKNNYNIDKNVLECFPASVTQLSNARKLYSLLGYNLNYYMSGTGNIYFQLKNTDFSNTLNQLIIPQFTQITDSSGEIVYTTLQAIQLTESDFGEPISVPVIEGTVQDFEVNGNSIITLNNLDNNLRLYFTGTQIAQNGIFITTVDNTFDLTTWKRVSNLAVEPLGTYVYEFGVLPDNNTCYIEFPQDISTLIGSGLNIKYTVSNGSSGNIKANILSNFVEDLSQGSGDDAVVINDYVTITQPSAIINGVDPESISEAYSNYKKTIGVFNTLVTRRDYENFIYEYTSNDKPIVSNVVVADRTCDLNYSDYAQIKSGVNNDSRTLLIQKSASNEPMLTAYDLVWYLLDYPNSVYNVATYNQSFREKDTASLDIQYDSDFQDIKSIQHDLKVPSGEKFNFNIMYPLKGTVITYYKVTTSEKDEIESNIKQALYSNFNARNLSYGKELSYDTIIDVIQNADARIKTVILDLPDCYPQLRKLTGETVNVYNDQPLDHLSLDNELVAKMVLAGNVQLFDFDTAFNYDFGQENGQLMSEEVNENTLTIIQSLTSHADIELSSSEYTLKSNELIQIFKPNLVTTTEYSSYVNYIFNSPASNTISPNIDYTLQAGETITLNYLDSNNVRKTSYINAGEIVNSNIEIQSGIAGSLSSGQYIRVESINQALIAPGTQYYFLLDNPTNTLYIPALDNVERKNNWIILQENEYFIYTNSNSSEIIVLGPGTRIENLSSVDINETLQKLNLSSVTQESIDSINWIRLQSTQQLNTIEMAITPLLKGSIVSIASGTLNLNNDPIILNTALTYKISSTSDPITLTPNSGYDILIQSRLQINTNNIQPQVLQDNQSLDIEFLNGSGTPLTIQPNSGQEIAFVFNTPIIMSGAVNANMQILTEDSLGYTLQGYYYTPSVISANLDLIRNDDDIIIIDSTTNLNQITFNYNFTQTDSDEFSYIIPVQTTLVNNSISFTINGVPLNLFNSGSANINTSGTYLLQIPTNQSGQLVLNITNSLTDSESIQIGKIVKLNGVNSAEIDAQDINYSYAVADNYSYIVEIINNILSNAGINGNEEGFDWTYQVPDEDKVTQPTLAKSYWDLNHVYNRYTIAQIDFNNYDLKVHSSSILRGV